jgi:polyisoprenoid-binding protein YceI
VRVTRYIIRPERSRLCIDARSSLHPIRSETDGLEGWLELAMAPQGWVTDEVTPKAHVELPVDRLRSGNALEDRELRRRIDARRFPTIGGDLTALNETETAGRYRVVGDVTFRGVTRRCEDEMTITVGGDGCLRLEGRSSFDIRDFGMEPPRILMLRVEPEVTVTVDIAASPQG